MILLWKPALCATGVIAVAVALLVLFAYWPGWALSVIVIFFVGLVVGTAWSMLYEYFEKRFP